VEDEASPGIANALPAVTSKGCEDRSRSSKARGNDEGCSSERWIRGAATLRALGLLSLGRAPAVRGVALGSAAVVVREDVGCTYDEDRDSRLRPWVVTAADVVWRRLVQELGSANTGSCEWT